MKYNRFLKSIFRFYKDGCLVNYGGTLCKDHCRDAHEWRHPFQACRSDDNEKEEEEEEEEGFAQEL